MRAPGAREVARGAEDEHAVRLLDALVEEGAQVVERRAVEEGGAAQHLAHQVGEVARVRRHLHLVVAAARQQSRGETCDLTRGRRCVVRCAVGIGGECSFYWHFRSHGDGALFWQSLLAGLWPCLGFGVTLSLSNLHAIE